MELNRDTFDELKGSADVDYLLNADFTNGIRNERVFSFCFGNPPYGKELTGAERIERTFFEEGDRLSGARCGPLLGYSHPPFR